METYGNIWTSLRYREDRTAWIADRHTCRCFSGNHEQLQNNFTISVQLVVMSIDVILKIKPVDSIPILQDPADYLFIYRSGGPGKHPVKII